MKRALTITGSLVVTLIGMLIAAIAVLLLTPLGMNLLDRFSRPVIEDVVRTQLGSEVSYAPLAGNLPGELVIRDLELSANGEVWAKADRFVLRWDPLDLLGNEVHIRDLVLADGALYAMPPEVEREESDEAEDEDSGDLSLPDIRVGDLVIHDFLVGEQIFGEEQIVTVHGGGLYRDERLRFRLGGRTEDGSDVVDIDAILDEEHIEADVVLVSRETGLVSRLIGAEGRTELRAKAAGPLTEIEAEIAGALGVYGNLTGALYGSVDDTSAIAATLTYEPGSFLPAEASALLGDSVTLDASGRYEGDTANLDIDDLTGAFGSIDGRIRAALGERRSAAAELQGTISDEAVTTLTSMQGEGQSAAVNSAIAAIAGPFSLDAEAEELGDGYVFSGTLSSGDVRLRIDNGRSTEEVPLSASVDLNATGLTLGDERLDPILSERLTASGAIQYTEAGAVSAEGLRVVAGSREGRRLMLTGSARFDTEAQRLASNVDLTAGPQTLALLLGRGTYASALTANVRATGVVDDLRVRLDAQLPGGQLDDISFSSGSLLADISGLPSSPSGNLTLRSQNDTYGGRAVISAAEDLLRVETLSFEAGTIAITGQGQANLAKGSGSAQLDVDAGRQSTLITGQSVGGTLSLDAEIQPENGPVNIAATGRGLRFEGNEIRALELSANGPREAISFELDATDITAGPLFLTELQTAGTLDIVQDMAARITTLIAEVPREDDNTVRLAGPTTISWKDGISVSPFEVDYFGDGVFEGQATLAQDRWVLSIDARDVPIPFTGDPISGQIRLDTSEEIPATFELAATAEVEDEASYTLNLGGRWDGSVVNSEASIVRDGEGELGQARASIPVRLTREPSIGIEMVDEGLEATLTYSDRLQPIFAFLPLETQPVRGRIDVDMRASGRPSAPQTEGSIRISDGRIEDTTLGLTLTNVRGDITFAVAEDGTRGEVDIIGSGASGREDSVKLTGTVSSRGTESSIDLSLNLDNAQVADNAELELRASSDLKLVGSFTELSLSGPINIDELDFTIPEFEGGESAPTYAPVNVVRVDGPDADQVNEIQAPEATPITINLDVSLRADDRIFVRGRGLTSEWSANLNIGGTVDEPLIDGRIELQEGDIDLAGRDFELSEGVISFRRSDSLNPLIDIAAQTEANDVTAIIDVEGPADDPEISFRSEPTLPEEDVLKLILFGKTTDLSVAEAVTLARVAAQLSAAGPIGAGGGFASGIRSSLGLDELSLGPEGRSLTVGKYISDDVYVSARQGIGDLGTVISVVYEVSRFFSLETTLSPTEERQTIGAVYKRDY